MEKAVKRETSNVKRETSKVKSQKSNLKSEKSKVKSETSDDKSQKSKVKSETSDVKRQKSSESVKHSSFDYQFSLTRASFARSLFVAYIILTSSFLIPNCLHAQMFWNQTASFAGTSSSYISIPNSSSLNITGNFSVEAWVNPSSLSGASKGIISKGGPLGTSLKYAIRLTTDGRVHLITNGASRLSSKTSSSLPLNTWTHIAFTYSSATGSFKLFINGNQDTTSVIAGAAPTTNTDSLFIGISGASTPFSGQIDELRLWNRELTNTEVNNYYRITLTENRNKYTGLILSMTFQDENSFNTDFNTRDMTGTGNNGNARSISSVSQSNSPYSTIHPNLSVFFTGASYMSGKDTSTLDAITAITLQCWVYPTSGSACTYISKGSSTTPAYFFGWSGSKLFAKINGTQITLNNGTVPVNKWTHVGFTYQNTGSYNFFINGEPMFAGIQSLGNINTSSDSIYIGGGPNSLFEFSGYIDEVRIMSERFSNKIDIKNGVHNSFDLANNPIGINVCYNLDGSLIDNCVAGPKLNIVNGGEFSYPASSILIPVSPTARDEQNSLSKGFYTRTPAKTIPSSGTSGFTFDTININEFLNITDINLFVGINHSLAADLDITLFAPNGDSVKVFSQTTVAGANSSISAVFDDDADSSLINNRYVTLSNNIKPLNSINSKFSGDNSQGTWIIKVEDKVLGNTGTLYGWGIQFNNHLTSRINFKVTSLIQGFYNSTTNLLTSDTLKIILAETTPPYEISDSSVTIINSNGVGLFSLSQSLFRRSLYVILKHRNSIETWASETVFIQDDKRQYFFQDNPARAFGSNQIQVDNNPENLFAIFGGDANREGSVDASDIVAVFNDANNFVTGYVNTDMTGDDFVDAADLILTFNNSNNFVSVIRP